MGFVRRVMSWPFQILGFVFFLGLVVVILIDGVRSIATGSLQLTRLGEVWFELSPGTLNLAQAAIQRHVTPFLWDPVVQTLLTWPAVVSLLILTVVFGLIARLIAGPNYGVRRIPRR